MLGFQLPGLLFSWFSIGSLLFLCIPIETQDNQFRKKNEFVRKRFYQPGAHIDELVLYLFGSLSFVLYIQRLLLLLEFLSHEHIMFQFTPEWAEIYGRLLLMNFQSLVLYVLPFLSRCTRLMTSKIQEADYFLLMCILFS